MHIRRAAPGHLSLLLPMVSAFCEAVGSSYEPVHATNALRPLLQDDRYGVVYLIENQGQVVGYTVIAWGWTVRSGGRNALIDQLFVDPSHGDLEAIALEEIVNDLKSRRVPTVDVTVRARDEDLRLLVGAHGFESDGSSRLSRTL